MRKPKAKRTTLPEFREAFATVNREASELLAPLSHEQINRAPAPGRWSVGQCISHLVETGKPLAANMQEAITNSGKKKRVEEPVSIRHGVFGKIFIYMLSPDTNLKIPTPDTFQPEGEPFEPHEIVAEFEGLQDAFIRCIDQSQHLDVNRMWLPSPAIPFVWFRMGTWLEATIQHEQRHLEQVRRTLGSIGISS